MNYRLIYTENYNKRARKFLKKHPELIRQYEKALKLLEINPQHPSLDFTASLANSKTFTPFPIELPLNFSLLKRKSSSLISALINEVW